MPLGVLEAVGGWDEGLVGYGYEDMELGARLQRIGTLAVHVADAVGFHLWHPKDWSRASIEAERNLDYVLRRLGVEAISDVYADWTVWWHYHRERGGAVVMVEGSHYALNRSRSHALVLPDSDWVAKLGFDGADVEPMTELDLAGIELVGPPAKLPMRRLAHVDRF
jgi:hypothetical protein